MRRRKRRETCYTLTNEAPTLIPSIGYLIVIIKSGLAWYCHHRESCWQSKNKNQTQKSSESRPNSESPCNKHMQQSEAVQDKSHKQLVRTKGYLRICAKDGHMGDETAPVDGTLRRNRYSISQPSEDNPSEKFIKHIPPRCLHLRI
jgi:hypothetical protein